MDPLYHDPLIPTTKICPTCLTEKYSNEFYRGCPRCKNCEQERRKQVAQERAPMFKDLPSTLMKICKSCHIEKPLEDFYESRNSKYGRTAQCKTCVIAKNGEYHAIHYQYRRQPKPAAINGGKVCNHCLIEKPLEQFTPSKQNKDGRIARCKECQNFISRENAYKRGTRHKRIPLPPALNGGKVCSKCLQEKPFEEFQNEPRRPDGCSTHCKECINAFGREYYAKRDKGPILQKNQQWYEANKARHRALVKNWTKENRTKTNQYGALRRARKKAVTIDTVDYEAIIERDGMWCYICEQAISLEQKMEFEHVIPIARGGAHSMENIKVAHMVCNRRKGDKLLSEMKPRQRRGII